MACENTESGTSYDGVAHSFNVMCNNNPLYPRYDEKNAEKGDVIGVKFRAHTNLKARSVRVASA